MSQMNETQENNEMNKMNSKYWQDVENKVLDPKTLSQEFSDDAFDSFSITKSRRSFLKIMGFSTAALPMTGCIKIPVRKAIPYLKKEPTVMVGVPNYYASTLGRVPVVMKTREGRPIKVEGNSKSAYTQGGADAQTQAQILSLYDSNRCKSAMVDGKPVEWSDFDADLREELENVVDKGQKVVVITPSMHSLSGTEALQVFLNKYRAEHIAFDSLSYNGWTGANAITHGERVMPVYNFANADVVVSFGVDFLGSFGDVVANTKGYSKRRNPKQKMNRHFQVEAMMTLTGTNADFRYTKTAATQRAMLLAMLAEIRGVRVPGAKLGSNDQAIVSKMVGELKAARGRSLVLFQSNDVDTQVLVNEINEALGNYGETLTVESGTPQVYAEDGLVHELFNRNDIGALVFWNTNLMHACPETAKLSKLLERVPTKVALCLSEDETSTTCNYIAATNHQLESWGDTYIANGEISVTQPTVQPLFATRMAEQTLLALAGDERSYDQFIKDTWASKLGIASPLAWNNALHEGVVQTGNVRAASYRSQSESALVNRAKKLNTLDAGMTLITYANVGIGDGAQVNNPWLQEMPDPVTKATWDNHLLVGPAHAKELGLKNGYEAKVSANGITELLPVIVQPGMAKNTVAIAVGYGRKVAGKVAKNLGVNAYPLQGSSNHTRSFENNDVTVEATGKERPVAQTQTHHSMEGRDIVRETTAAEYAVKANAGNEKKALIVDIYDSHYEGEKGHQWAMAIDLNSCTGCSACIVSCNAENNIPVVGKQEVINRREMHWMRLDRYYAGDEEQPEVVHMPMLCQHCENAPCENVCPVLATLHSSDGLNQQVYNRCVGTRYCANNCPYKVRRFNWFNYDHSDEVENMVLNPDVTVRSRGVMEKCSMCTQRIQAGKLDAKRNRQELKDGAIKTACQQSCPSNAIVFGDMKDPSSEISQFLKDERNYTVLEELNVKPRVSYLTKVRNN